MGTYLNPGYENFRRTLVADIYVDKTMMIDVTNSFIEKGNNYICISRPRRFGKTVAGNMLAAYYSKGCDSSALFSQYKIARTSGYTKHLNKYNVIQIDMNSEYQMRNKDRSLIMSLTKDIRKELMSEYSDIEFEEDESLARSILKVHATKGETFVILLDEHDVLVRENADEELIKEYLSFLNGLFKSNTLRPAITLAYLTGILPVIRDKVQSKLNNFIEYTILDAGLLGEYVGFTSEEVRDLCNRYSVDYEECSRWYDGYRQRNIQNNMQHSFEIYSPESVVQCITNKRFDSYWGRTSSYEVISDRIRKNYHGTKDAVIRLLAGEKVSVNSTSFLNTMTSFKTKDDLLTYLMHVGYLAFNQEDNTCHIPNKEVRQEWLNAIKSDTEDEYTVTNRIIQDSKELLASTIEEDSEAVAKALDTSHIHIASNRSYNNEDVLQSAIYLAYIYALNRYSVFREMTTGKGFADVVFVPFSEDDPAMIIELKKNGSAESAIDQIREKRYYDSLAHYSGRLLFVGINYDEKSKNHTCIIERFTKRGIQFDQPVELYKFLIEIDTGYKLSQYEIKILNEITSIEWHNITELPKCIGLLSSLTNLDLSSSNVSDINALSGLKTLRNLDLRDTKVSDISVLENLKVLISLDLGGTKVTDINTLKVLSSLTYLDLSKIEIKDLSVLSSLTALKRLNIQNSKTSSIPESILDLNLPFIFDKAINISTFSDEGIYIHGLALTDQPIEIFSQNRELIRAYYREGDQVPVNECKVIFLGDAESGKTHSIKRLLNNGEFLKDFDGEATPGIEITVNPTKLANTDIVINYWDFGGQEIQHSMHRVFLTERTVYVVFLNARQDDLMDERARYWMENIKAFAPDAPVLVVINKIDQNEHPRFNEKGFIDTYGEQVKKIIRLSAKTDEKQVFLDKLQGNINSIIKELPTVSKKIPRSWKKLMRNVREMTDHYLTADQFIKKCQANSIKNYEDIHDELVDLFQVIGISFCYYQNRAVADYLLLNPKWMLNALYTIVTNGKTVAQNGVITQDNLYDLLEKDTLNGSTIRRVIPELRYKAVEVNYILGIIRMLGLSYSMKDGSEFFPMLCDRDEKTTVRDVVPKDALHFIFRYTYLPTNIMHRLIVEMHNDLDYQYVWYTGAVFKNTQQNQTAYIHSLGNELHIYVYGEDKYYNLNEYLVPITNIVRNITDGMGLSAVEYLTFRINEVEAEFALEEVKGNLRNGIINVYNARLDEVISLKELTQHYLIMRLTQDDLLKSVVNALHVMQRDKTFSSSDENARNRFISALVTAQLKGTGNVSADQQTGGTSSTGKSIGERDFVIKDEIGQEILIYEGLNLKSLNKAYLDKHIDKVLVNYNPQGLRYSILVTYLECDRDRFKSFSDDYRRHIAEYAPKSYSCIGEPEEVDIDGEFLRCMKMQYEVGGLHFTIYHIIVRMGQ